MSKTYEWDDLTWNKVQGKTDVWRTRLDLLPAEKLRVEEGWVITGPIRVSFRWDKPKKHTRVWYKSLPVSVLDLDDPNTYPCRACKAKRGQACTGNDPRCSFRVFLIKGGKL